MICDWWISIRFVCFCVSRFVTCDRNYDWRQRKTQLRRRLLNFRVRMFVKSAVIENVFSSPGIHFLNPGPKVPRLVKRAHLSKSGRYWLVRTFGHRPLQRLGRASLVPSRPRRFRMRRHLSSLSEKFAIVLRSKPPLVTRIAPTGLGTKLAVFTIARIVWAEVSFLWLCEQKDKTHVSVTVPGGDRKIRTA